MSSKKKDATNTLKPSEVASALRYAFNTDRSVFIWGPPGISKSQVTQQVATERGEAFIDLRLSQLDPTDLRGIPYPTKFGGREGVKWSVPYALPEDIALNFVVAVTDPGEITIPIANPKGSNGIHYCTNPKITVKALTAGLTAEIVQQYVEDDDGEILYFDGEGEITTEGKGEPKPVPNLDKVVVRLVDANGVESTGKVRVQAKGRVRGILALEEFNSAPPSVQASAYQFVLDRRLGEYIVPKGFKIVAMGNRDTDKGITYKMSTPVANRFLHIEMHADFLDWQIWALNSGIHSDVLGYVSAFKHELFEFDPGTAARGFATPRSWHAVSDVMHAAADMPESVARGLITGAVGEAIGFKFIQFRKLARDLPPSELVLNGKLTKLDKEVELSLQYALTTTLCYELLERAKKFMRKDGWQHGAEHTKWMEEADNFIAFLMNNFQAEISIMATRFAIQIHKLPFHMSKMKNFLKFADAYRSLVMA